MVTTLLITAATFAPLLLLGVFLLGRYWQRWQSTRDAVTEVARQHFDIFQTGEFNEAAVESVKRRFRVLFEHGGERAVEASIQPGPHFIYQVRALAEIGTDAAGRILERQLARRLSSNKLEQAWYWIDLASSLRVLNREESLPQLLRCADRARESPLGHFYAAEIACFLGFAGYLREPRTTLGVAALRILLRAIEGMRSGIAPVFILESRVGEEIESMWDHRPDGISALHVRIAHEVLRLLRRAPHLKLVHGAESADGEVLDWQFSRIAALEPAMRAYLAEAPAALLARVVALKGPAQADVLKALVDLRVDAGSVLFPMLDQLNCANRELMVSLLRWSRSAETAAWMRTHVRKHVSLEKRGRRYLQADLPARPSVPPHAAYCDVLRSLRGHPSVETEKFLIQACADWDPEIRIAALGSLGWWEPIATTEVRACLSVCRRDPSPDVRQSARAALARLGERGALHWFRQTLFADDPQQLAEAVHVIAEEGLTLLWPDLDRLLDSDNAEVILHAREAGERLAEQMEQLA